MARPLWTGTLRFGLVSIPVGVHTAVRDRGPHFHFLRRRDKSRVRFQKIAVSDEKPVSKDDLVKGYEYEKGRYVVLEDADFEKAALNRSRAIDIIDFVDAEAIDDRYFNTPYYLVPTSGAESAYALLRDAMRRTGRTGIGKFVLRGTQHLAAVQAIDDAIVLTTMRFRDELAPLSAFQFPKSASVRDKDLKLAEQLIHTLDAEWEPDKYTNEYRKNLMSVIEAKRKRQRPTLEAAEAPGGADVIDLMERLRKSLGQGAPRAKTTRTDRTRKSRKSRRAA
jgi:DNA end-binding protein Ku